MRATRHPGSGSSGGRKQRRRLRRFALVVIVEAPDARAAWRLMDKARDGGTGGPVWISDPCPVGPASAYEITEIRLLADGDLAVTVPLA